MTILSSEEIFNIYVSDQLDKFSLALYANVPSLSSLPEETIKRIYKEYYNFDCEFSFYFWLEVIKLLKENNYTRVSRDAAEHLLMSFEESNYGIIISGNNTHYLYISLKGYGELYEFKSVDECKKFAKSQREIFAVYVA
ncbi:hypothetical protein UB32_16355 [Mesobacillus subterraneus]|uniref:Uncharacterized protein n=2 Tax=Mesobacillus TaxID=2675231 RepID=A0A0D6Z5U9_9BACI|nr:hypothetical protein UB32_16355 [Mesobacillus subterraneus]MDQ0414900.1 hypothetical protein [Mesobacillus stamsii]